MTHDNQTNSTPTHTLDFQEEQAIKFLNSEQNQLGMKVSNWNKVNLRNVGFKLAGLTAASTDALVIALNRIKEAVVLNAAKKEEEDNQLATQKIDSIDQKIEEQKANKAINATKVKTYEDSKIPLAQSKVTQLNDDLEDLQINISQELEIEHSSKISKIAYIVFGILGLAWIYAFYLSASYSAFFRGTGVESVSDISNLFASVFTFEAFQHFNFHWFLPFMFLLIGTVLHIALESTSRIRILQILSAILLIVISDGILAYVVESKAHSLKFITGQIGSSDYGLSMALKSPSFYMILIMGSISVITWSLLFTKICSFYSTNKVTKGLLIKQRNIKKKISAEMSKVNELIAECEEIKAGFELIEGNLNILKEQREHITENGLPITFSKSDLKNNLLAFYTGWTTNVSAYNYKNLEDRTRKSFINTINGLDLVIAGFNSEATIVELNKAS